MCKIMVFQVQWWITKPLTQINFYSQVIGHQKERFSADIPSGVHIPSGVPTPVVSVESTDAFKRRLDEYWGSSEVYKTPF